MYVMSTNSIVTAYSSVSTAGSTKSSAAQAVIPANTDMPDSFKIETTDFAHMTRQEMFDWMSDQIKSGKMTFEQSTPFLGMTLKISEGGEPVDMSTDNTIYNFMDSARQGIEGAHWRNDGKAARTLEEALAIMQREQGTITKINVTA